MGAPLDALRRDFDALVDRLGDDDPTHHEWFRLGREDNGSPHVEHDGRAYHYVVTERGGELERRTTTDADEVLYWLLSDVAFHIALRYERARRRPGVDTRRLWFARKEELLGALRPEWGEACRREHEAVLREHPFVDGRD